MMHSPQPPASIGPLSGELVLRIARDLENITDQIAEMKALCDQQMGELADAAAAAAGITATMAHQQAPVAVDSDFAGLKAELSNLYETVEAQAEIYKNISRQFLGIARQVGAEIKALRDAGAPAEKNAPATGENVVWLSARREAQDDAVAQAAANDLLLALQGMQESAAAMFRAQAQSRKMVTSLRQRMRAHRQRTRTT